jgi:protein-tyrosine phosphatase
LKNENIQYIVNVTPDIPIYFPKDFNYCRIPIDDRSDVNIHPYLAPASDYIESNIQKGNVFVHCYAGISRSASIIIAYLILKKNYTYEDAYNLVKSKRPIIHPNPGFNEILKKL